MAMGWIAVPPYVKNKRNPNQIFEEKLLKRFENEHRRQELRTEKENRRKQLEDLRLRQEHRRIIYEAFQERYLQSRLEEQYAIAIHNCLRGNWHEMQQLDYSMEVSITHKNTMQQMRQQEELIRQAIKDFAEFENKGYELGVDTPPDGKKRDTKLSGKKEKASTPEKKGKEVGKKTDPKLKKGQEDESPPLDPVRLAQDGKAYMDDIKRRKAEEEAQRFQEDIMKRKKRVLQQQLAIEEEIAQKEAQKDDFERNFSDEALRRQETKRMEKEEELSWIAHRILLTQMIVEQRDKEWDLVLARDHEMLMMLREDYWQETQKECQLREEEKKLKKKQERADGRRFCFELLLQILSLAENAVTYKESTQCDVPTTEWNDWKILFLKGAVVPSPLQYLTLTSTEEATLEVEVIADEFVLEYINEKEEWEGLNIGKNTHLGRILGCIHDIAHVPCVPPPSELPNLSEFKVKLAILGNPYAGKTTLTQKLATEFGLIIIEIEKVIAMAIDMGVNEKSTLEAEIDDNTAEDMERNKVRDPMPSERNNIEDPAPEISPTVSRLERMLSPMARLGLAAQNALDSGRQIPDEVVVKMLVLTFTSLDHYVKGSAMLSQKQAAKGSGDAPKQKGKGGGGGAKPPPKPAKGGKGGTPPGSKPTTAQSAKKGQKRGPGDSEAEKGFILDGFPATCAQADLLEKHLTGLDLSFISQHAANASIIAPPPPVPVEKVVSGLDGLLCLPYISPEDGIKRALGKCVDPKTGRQYHLLFDPPPKDDKTGITSRLQNVEQAPVVQTRITEGEKVWKPLSAFIHRFANAFLLKYEPFTVVVRDIAEKQSGKDPKGAAQGKGGAPAKAPKLDAKTGSQKPDSPKAGPKSGAGDKSDGKPGKATAAAPAAEPAPAPAPAAPPAAALPNPVENPDTSAEEQKQALQAREAGNCEYKGECAGLSVPKEAVAAVVEAKDPSTLVQSLLDARIQSKLATAAAEAAKAADEAAARALIETEKATETTTNLAQQLLFVKVAEVKAAALIEKSGPDATAQKIVKAEASQVVGKKLTEASKALQETESAAQVAQKAAEQALKAAEAAHEGASLAGAALKAKADAEAAAEAASQAATKAAQSGQKAKLALEAAVAAIDKVKQDIERLENPDGDAESETPPPATSATSKKEVATKKAEAAAPDKKEGKTATPPKDAKKEKAAAKGKAKDGVTEKKAKGQPGPAAPEPPPEVEAVPPEPPFMEKQLAELFHAQWVSIEMRYLQTLKDVFSKLRRGRPITRYKMKEVKLAFVEYLKRPDDKQTVLEEYQGRYNRIDFKQRSDKKIVPKLQIESDKLKTKLQSICDTHLQEAQNWRSSSFADWLDKRTAAIVSLFTFFLQAEFDKYLETCSHLQEFQARQLGSTNLEAFRADLTTAPDKVPAKKGAAASPQKKPQPGKGKQEEKVATPRPLPSTTQPLPGWLEALWYTVPDLFPVVNRAVSSGENIMKAATQFYSAASNAKGPKDKSTPAPDKKGKKDELKALEQKIKGGNAREPPKVNDQPDEISDTVLRENEIFRGRVELIVRKACVYIGELQPMIESTSKLMETWMMDRYNAECQAVAEVVELAERAVAEGIPLWYRLKLDGETFTVDENHLILVPPAPLGLDPAPDLVVWHMEILEQAVEDFRTLAPMGVAAFCSHASSLGYRSHSVYCTGVLPVCQARSILSNCVEVVHNSVKDDLKQTVIPRLPGTKRRPAGPFQVWIDNFEATMKESIYDPEAGEHTRVDWRALLITLADTRYNKCISGATLEDIARARKVIEGGRKIKFCLSSQGFQKMRLWLDLEEKGGSERIGAHLKKVVHTMLDGGKPGVPWQRLLLFLCRDVDRRIALLKAFSVLSSQEVASEPPDITAEMLLEALYPYGVEAAAAAGCATWSQEELIELLADIRHEKGLVVPVRAAEGDCGGSREAVRGSEISAQTPPAEVKYVRDESDLLKPFEIHSRASDISEFSDHTNFAIREFLSHLETCTESLASTDNRISEFSEQTAITVQEFLDACSQAYPRSNKKQAEEVSASPESSQNSKDDEEDAEATGPKETPIRVFDLFETGAATIVREALVSNYGRTCVPGYLYQMQLKETNQNASHLLAGGPSEESRPTSSEFSAF